MDAVRCAERVGELAAPIDLTHNAPLPSRPSAGNWRPNPMQLKPIAVSIALSVASSALTAAIVLTVARPPSAAADAGIIKARELDLIDDNGATEAQLTLTGQGAALLLNDANGVTRVFLSGSSGIAQVNDSSGLTRAGMGTGDSGVPAVWLADSGRQNVVLLRQQADGTGVVATRLKDGSLVQVSP